ncbi:helix-turn-helix transcriptional regulator [Paenibacillus qinlingensis]|nr:helix-turn-helix transcriptional regulator [Paenibacillus qinlingensis]
MSEKITVSPTTVKRWLEGRFEPGHRNLSRLADALYVPSDILLGIT